MIGTEDQMRQLVDQLRQVPGVVAQVSGLEGEVVSDALDGKSVYEIAQDHHLSEEKVWEILNSTAHAAGLAGDEDDDLRPGGASSSGPPGGP